MGCPIVDADSRIRTSEHCSEARTTSVAPIVDVASNTVATTLLTFLAMVHVKDLLTLGKSISILTTEFIISRHFTLK